MVMVKPEYPQLAKTYRIQGDVKLQAIIDRDGRVVELVVVEGHPMLTKAAQDAVQQWRYKPTLLNNEAVEVATEIIVRFRLA